MNKTNHDDQLTGLYYKNLKIGQELWNDDHYLNSSETARVTEAFKRLKLMVNQTKNPGSCYYRNQELIQTNIHLLEYLLNHVYGPHTEEIQGNWWDKEIGSPALLLDIVDSYHELLSDEMIKQTIETIDRFVPLANKSVQRGSFEKGANLSDKIMIVIKRSKLDHNAEKLEHAIDCMSPLFSYVDHDDGFYVDGGYIQHHKVPYNGDYGLVLLEGLVNILKELLLCHHPEAQKKMKFFNQIIMNNYLPFIGYGCNVMDIVKGRAVSRKAHEGNKLGLKMIAVLLKYCCYCDPKMKEELECRLYSLLKQRQKEISNEDRELLNEEEEESIKALLKKDYPVSLRNEVLIMNSIDRFVVHRHHYSFACALASCRTYNAEQGNKENIRGRYQGQGYYQIYDDHNDNYNRGYNALVDPYRLNGVTTAHQDLSFSYKGNAELSRGLDLYHEIGLYGYYIDGHKPISEYVEGFFDENELGYNSGIRAYKTYFILEEGICCVGSGIEDLKTDPHVQQLETIVLNHPVDDKAIEVDQVQHQGTKIYQHVDSIYLPSEKLGIKLLNMNNIKVEELQRQGCWHDVNELEEYTDYTVMNQKFITVSVQHDLNKKNKYSYMILPGMTREEFMNYPQDRYEVEVQEDIHAVFDRVNKRWMIAFYNKNEYQGI